MRSDPQAMQRKLKEGNCFTNSLLFSNRDPGAKQVFISQPFDEALN